MMSSVLTVSQVNTFLKSLIESDGRLKDFFISGEISNFTNHYKSGHLYFSLKDEKSVIKAVMFSTAARRLKFMPQNGMKVIIRGRISVYEPSGQYQLYAEDMQPDGIGALSIAFEQLKEKLGKEGLFDASEKREILRYPERIAVITSATGAAVRDILQITKRRWPVAEICLYPVLVQGDSAAGQLVSAVRKVNEQAKCDVIIIGRGGGSMEDLWAFNDEALAREIFASEIPVISAVGHETDFTICDFVADLRAPTPSAAAELCTPDIEREMQELRAYREYFNRFMRNKIERERQKLDSIMEDSLLLFPERLYENRREDLDILENKLIKAARLQIEKKQAKHEVLSGKLDALSPLKVLARGYSVVYDENGKMLDNIQKVKQGDKLKIYMTGGKASAVVENVEREGK